MPGTALPRNVIYINGFSVAVQQPDGSTANFPYPSISNFSYTDVILGFLIPDPSGYGNLIGDGSVLPGSDHNDPLGPYLQAAITRFQNAGQNALVSVGGAWGWVPDPTHCPHSSINFNAWQSYSNNVTQLANQIVSFVQQYGFNGVDIDYEDDSGFTGGYDGIDFLSTLTSELAQALPPGQALSPMPHRRPIGTQNTTRRHTLRYGSKSVIRSRGLITNSTITQDTIETPLLKYSGITLSPTLWVEDSNSWLAPFLSQGQTATSPWTK